MEEYLQLNAIQHFAFCKRQWALINLEQVWSENEDTTLGQYVHQNVDDMYFDEKRSDRVIIRSLPIFSNKLKLNGISDLVEFKKSKNGIPIFNYE